MYKYLNLLVMLSVVGMLSGSLMAIDPLDDGEGREVAPGANITGQAGDVQANLEGLPVELIEKVVSFLPKNDVGQFAQTCRAARTAVNRYRTLVVPTLLQQSLTLCAQEYIQIVDYSNGQKIPSIGLPLFQSSELLVSTRRYYELLPPSVREKTFREKLSILGIFAATTDSLVFQIAKSIEGLEEVNLYVIMMQSLKTERRRLTDLEEGALWHQFMTYTVFSKSNKAIDNWATTCLRPALFGDEKSEKSSGVMGKKAIAKSAVGPFRRFIIENYIRATPDVVFFDSSKYLLVKPVDLIATCQHISRLSKNVVGVDFNENKIVCDSHHIFLKSL